MRAPAAVMGDRVTGTCVMHLIPNPASGIPQPGPPLPFSAPLLQNLATTVLIAGKPAATIGSTGVNTLRTSASTRRTRSWCPWPSRGS